MILLYRFSATNMHNVRIGVDNQIWAVREQTHEPTTKSFVTRANKIHVGSVGIFYVKGKLTTPFVFLTTPRLGEPVPEHLWEGRWMMPFRFHPLGTPDIVGSGRKLRKVLPFARDKIGNLNVFRPQALATFSPIVISDLDWAMIVSALATPAPVLSIDAGKQLVSVVTQRIDEPQIVSQQP